MKYIGFDDLTNRIKTIKPVRMLGRVAGNNGALITITGLSGTCRLGDSVMIRLRDGRHIQGEILRFSRDTVEVLPEGASLGVALGDEVELTVKKTFCPDDSWIGRIIDADGQPLDGRPLSEGDQHFEHISAPPPAAQRRALGARIETGNRLFNTILPLARGQRIGLFSGSGVGKSTLIGQFARNTQTDVTVIALVGERGRELREFVEKTLGEDGMARSIIVVATSDRSPLEKRRAAWAAMAVAEYFRDAGRQVLLVVDSLTRFAESHREVALAAGEPASMRGFPPSVSQVIMSLCERAGPGCGDAGDITAIFSVLVAGSDMDEPIADIVRGVLDGHIVLDRKIAERGRFPAVDVLRSVSRSLPDVASRAENETIMVARKLLGAYDSAEMMVQAGLYSKGSDPLVDDAVQCFPALDKFFSEVEPGTAEDSFAALSSCVDVQPADRNSEETDLDPEGS